jgi:hypothetical protein
LIAEACDWNFGLGLHKAAGHAAQSWEQSIDQAALTLRYGAMFEEIVWGDLLTWRRSTATRAADHPDRAARTTAPPHDPVGEVAQRPDQRGRAEPAEHPADPR